MIAIPHWQWLRGYAHPASGNHTIKLRVTFAHNLTRLSATGVLRDGLVRPSAVDSRDPSWLPVSTFYCRASVARGPEPHHLEDSLQRTILLAQKFSDLTKTRDVAALGVGHGRQNYHLTIHHGGILCEHSATFFFDIVHGRSDQRWATNTYDPVAGICSYHAKEDHCPYVSSRCIVVSFMRFQSV